MSGYVTEIFLDKNGQTTLQPLYNTIRYNMVLDITRFKDESQKCVDYILKNDHKWSFFQYNLDIFVRI